jgi:hypothetical protein
MILSKEEIQMKQVIIYRSEKEEMGMIGNHPLTLEMTDCLIHQYRIMGWTERATVSPDLYHFTIDE